MREMTDRERQEYEKHMAIARKVAEAIEKSPRITETWVRDEHGGMTVSRINEDLILKSNHVIYKGVAIAVLCTSETFGSNEPWRMICEAFRSKEKQTKEEITNQFLNT